MQRKSKMPAKIAMTESTIKLDSNGTGQIRAVVPMTNRILKILLPTMLPTAIAELPFLAAVTEVTSSGRDVPNATIVRPIKRSLNPNILAKAVAPLTVTLLPRMIKTIPAMV